MIQWFIDRRWGWHRVGLSSRYFSGDITHARLLQPRMRSLKRSEMCSTQILRPIPRARSTPRFLHRASMTFLMWTLWTCTSFVLSQGLRPHQKCRCAVLWRNLERDLNHRLQIQFFDARVRQCGALRGRMSDFWITVKHGESETWPSQLV